MTTVPPKVIGESLQRLEDPPLVRGRGRFIADVCNEVVELGPINASIHKLDEHILLADLDALSRIYQLTLADILDGR